MPCHFKAYRFGSCHSIHSTSCHAMQYTLDQYPSCPSYFIILNWLSHLKNRNHVVKGINFVRTHSIHYRYHQRENKAIRTNQQQHKHKARIQILAKRTWYDQNRVRCRKLIHEKYVDKMFKGEHFRALMCLIHRYGVFPVAWYSVEEAV